ncbi:hypothetical protein TNCV_1328291 [Trichonephila clavipes]|nr:hypothetical protein TNCV_1328291 [Trichonephila clavipes]
MITNFFIPELNNHDVQELWFQQDGATCHTARATIDLLKDTFAGHACSQHPRVPRAHQAGFSRRSLAGVGFFESGRCHEPGLALLTNGGVQQQTEREKSKEVVNKLLAKRDLLTPRHPDSLRLGHTHSNGFR